MVLCRFWRHFLNGMQNFFTCMSFNWLKSNKSYSNTCKFNKSIQRNPKATNPFESYTTYPTGVPGIFNCNCTVYYTITHCFWGMYMKCITKKSCTSRACKWCTTFLNPFWHPEKTVCYGFITLIGSLKVVHHGQLSSDWLLKSCTSWSLRHVFWLAIKKLYIMVS